MSHRRRQANWTVRATLTHFLIFFESSIHTIENLCKRLAEHARRLSRKWERGGDRRTRFGSLIKTKTYHANTESFVRPGIKIRLQFQYRYRFLKEGLNETDFPL